MTLNIDTLLQYVDQILGPNGLITSNQHITHNPQQHAYARHVAMGLLRYDSEHRKAAINLLEAATGTGKTIGYLVPVMLYSALTGERVAISTYTRQLQKQIESDDAQIVNGWVHDVLGQTLTIKRRVGYKNFLSHTKVIALLDHLESCNDHQYDAAIEFLYDAIRWINSPNSSGLLDDFIENIGITAQPFGIAWDDILLDNKSQKSEYVNHHRMVEQSKQADIVIVNHALTIVNALQWTSVLDDTDHRPISILVCDEADKLPDVANSFSRADLSLHKLRSIVGKIASAENESNPISLVNMLYDYVAGLYCGETSTLVKNASALEQNIKLTKLALMPVYNKLMKKLKHASNTDYSVFQFFDFVDALDQIQQALNNEDGAVVVTFTESGKFPSLVVATINPGRILSRLWNLKSWKSDKENGESDEPVLPRSYLKAALLTSATLTVPGRDAVEQFDDFASSVGIIRHQSIHNACTDLYATFEPHAFGSLKFVLADMNAHSPAIKIETEDDESSAISNPLWLDYCTNMVKAAHQQGGRALVLTLSYSDTQEIARRLSDEDNIIEHKRGESLQSALDLFISNPQSILISPNAWEGVNLPGMIKQLVITRIPFQPVNKGYDLINRMHLRSKGFSTDKANGVLYTRAISMTRRILKQGIGRPIRSKSDGATVWIADNRFPTPDAFKYSLDQTLLSVPKIHQYPSFLHCIPERFRNEFEHAALFLLDDRIHTPAT